MSLGSRSVAVLGAHGAVAELVLAALVEDASVHRVVAVAHARPSGLPRSVRFESLDLHGDSAPDRLADIIDAHDIDTVVHLGYLAECDASQEDQTSEVERIIEGLGRRTVPKVIFCSSTAIYDALPGDPTHLSERTPLVRDAQSAWVRDKVACEERIAQYALEADAAITILRFATVLGATVRTFMTEYLFRSAVPTVMGVDPPVQFVHEADVSGAIHHAVRRNREGSFNIVGDGALPLSVVLRIGRRRSVPVPELGSYPLTQLLWEESVVETPEFLNDLFRYVWIADGARASTSLGYQTRFSTKEAVEEFYRPGARG